ncbi:hypothetical protein CBC_A0736 [Clostridium botulinum C str. Eklund]|nr:hypothetical protein CBC_A0736 [Clostridium botulinum C str. Eklund]
MKNITEILILIGISIFSFLIFVYHVIIASDIPVNISYNEFILFIKLDIVYLIIYIIYIIKKASYIKANIFLLLFQMGFAFIGLVNDIHYKYHKYCTLISIISFSIKIIILILLIYKLVKIVKNNKNMEKTRLG